MIENIKQKILDIYNKIIEYLKKLTAIPIINIPSTLLKDFLTLFNNITVLFIQLLDYIVNEKKSFMLRSAIFLLIILGSIFYLFTFFNIGNLKKRENNNLVSVIFIGLFISIFYFFVYRNNYLNNKDKEDPSNLYYTQEKNTFLKNDSKDQPKDEVNYDNLKNYFLYPLITFFKSIASILFIILALVFIITLIFYAYNYNHYLFSITKYIILFLIFVTLIAILLKFLVFSDSSKIESTSWLNEILKDDTSKNKGFTYYLKLIYLILKYLIFLLPCLLIAFTDYIHKEIKLTPSPVYLLLIFEILLILALFFLPLVFNFFNTLNKNDLLNGEGPFYLNKRKTIGIFQELGKNSKKNSTVTKNVFSLYNPFIEKEHKFSVSTNGQIRKKFPYNYSYNLSFKIYLNPQENNTSLAYNRETSLFNYGFKPIVLYDGKSKEIIIKSKTKDNISYDLKEIYRTKNIKYQKWVQFVINYDNNEIDVFIDGKLVANKKNIPPYMGDESVTIGEKDGIHGSIKDVYYYERPKPLENIEFMYDLMKN